MRLAKTLVFVAIGFWLFLIAAPEAHGQSLPSGWTDQDVGTVGVAGSASYSNSVFTVSGAGHSLTYGTTDGFNFLYQQMTGNGYIIARVASESNYPQAGVMIRETLDSGATNMVVMQAYSSIYQAYRTSTGGSNSYTSGPSAPSSYWVEVSRSGSTFNGFYSADGINWTSMGSQTINMQQTVYIGLVATSQTTGYTSSATFDSVSVSTSSNTPPQITSVSATEVTAGSQETITGTGFGASQGNSLALFGGTSLAVTSWSATSITVTLPSSGTSGELLVSVAPSMNDSNPIKLIFTSNPLPTGWLDADIGVTGAAGSAAYANGIFTGIGSGNGLMGATTSDQFHFIYQSWTGDGTIIARVISATNSYSEAGVMVRQSLNSGDATVAIFDYAGSITNAERMIPGTGSTGAGDTSGSLPYWVKLVRSNGSFVGYASPDGASWTMVVGPMPVQMSQSVYIGLVVSSASAGSLVTATFDNVSVTANTNSGPQITGVSATNGSIGSQVVISGSGFGSSQGSNSVLLNDSPVTVNSWSATSISTTIPTGATSGYLIVLLSPSMLTSNAIYYTITLQPLPSPWLDKDVGPVGTFGSATYSGGVFTVQGAGSGVGGESDGFHFVYQPLTSNGSIIAQVTSQTSGALVGVMVRETLTSGSAEMFSYTQNVNNQYTSSNMNYRTVATGYAIQASGPNVTAPYWLEVTRTANTFSAYYSTDGTSWSQIGSTQAIATAEAVYVGLGVSSTSTSTLDSATFANVSISYGSTLPNPQISGFSPTSGPPGTLVTITGSGFGSTQATGSTVQFNGKNGIVQDWSDTLIHALVFEDTDTGPVQVQVGGIAFVSSNFNVIFTAKVTDSLGHSTTYHSALAGEEWKFTDSEGSRCSTCTVGGGYTNQYSANGSPMSSVDPNGNNTLWAFDSTGDLVTQFSPLGGETAATTTYTYNYMGEVTQMTDPLNNVTTYGYDSHGNLLSVTTPQPNNTTAASVTNFTYNSLGELTQITDPLNNVTKVTYTPQGYISTITDAQSNVTTYGYDSRGNRTSITDALNHQTTFTYDAGNRLTQITYPDTTSASFTYDYRGRRITATDQNGKTTSYAYDAADRLTSITDAANNVTQYTYDTEGNLLSLEDANNHTTSFQYDANGRVTQTTFPSNLVETYAYDANNNLTSKTDRKNQTIQYVYDALNRLTQKNYPDGTSADYTYDLVGKVLQANDPTGTYGFAYDNMGRLIGTTTTYSFLPNTTFTNSYTYDAASNRTGFTAPDGSTNTYTYDALNRVSTLASSWAGSFGFSYDALNRRAQMTRPNNVTTNYTYDNLSHLLSVLHQVGTSTIDGASYTLDSAGNRTAKTDYLAGVTSNYTYDPLYELTKVTQGTNTTESYSYDLVGNRLSSLGAAPYSYNASNELTSTPSASYSYDYNGNTTSETISSNATNYTWDFENRLTQVTLPGTGGTVTFKYDPFGRRVEKTSPTATNIFAYDGDNLVQTVSGSGSEVAGFAQGLGLDEPLAMLRGSTTSYYQADGLGSISSLSNSTGALAQTYTYDSLGNLINSSGSLTNFFRYTGREFDSETNLYFNRARYLDPATGRFSSEDPIRFWGGNNFYSYTGNSPVNFIDPTGYSPDAPCLDINKFVKTLIEGTGGKTTSGGNCAENVRRALSAGGIPTQGHPQYAKDYGPFLLQRGFSQVPPDNYSQQIGDIIVFQAYPGQQPQAGHIQGWTGSNWVSDFIQPPHGIYPGPPYRKAQVPYAIYRPQPCP